MFVIMGWEVCDYWVVVFEIVDIVDVLVVMVGVVIFIGGVAFVIVIGIDG